jgi:perosamine synthetase
MAYKIFPPTGHKIFFRDLFRNNPAFLPEGFPTNSGTTALYFIISELNIPSGSKIIIPAYSCPSVAAAVLRAGHIPLLADISPESLSYDINSLAQKIRESGAKALVWVNLFGLNDRIPNTNIPVILDNAQAVLSQARIHNIAAAIYSFGRGKPLNSLSGGLAVIFASKYFRNLEKEYKTLSEIKPLQEFKYLLTVFAFKLFFNPFRYPIPVNLPFLNLGETVFEPDFPISKMLSRNKIVILNILRRFEKIEENRKRISQSYRKILLDFKDFLYLYEKNVYYRFPVLLKSSELRLKLEQSLKNIGISFTRLYPTPLNEQPGLAEILNNNNVYPGAKIVSEQLMTLPINEFIDEKVLNKIQRVFKNILH